jgi:hypothetical protein
VEAPVTVATKSTDFRQELGVPVGVAHEVVTSERYLFTLDGSETDPGTMVVSEHEIDRRDDGSVYARAVAGKADTRCTSPAVSGSRAEVRSQDGKIDLSVRSAGISFRGRRGHCRTKGASARMIGRRHVCFRCGGVSPAAGG